MNIDIFDKTLSDVRSCSLCIKHLPHGVRPVVQIDPNAKILIAGQAPGSKVHKTGIPFDDPSDLFPLSAKFVYVVIPCIII